MKHSWEKTRLADLCTIKGRIGYRGYTKQDLVQKGQGAITLSPSNIKGDRLIFDKCTYISWVKYDESPEIMIYEGDIIYCKTASVGKMALVEYLPEKATLNPQFVVLKNLKCSNKFLYYYMISQEFRRQAKNITGGTAVPTLSQKNLGNLSVPVPPLPEQKYIVAKLDETFEAIDKAKANVEQNLQNAKDLFQSKLNEIFSQKGEGWVEKELGDVCYVLNGYAFKSADTVEDSNTQLLRMGNLYKNKLDLNRKPVFYPENFSREYEDYVLEPLDLVMSLTGTVGKRDYGFTVEIPETPLKLLLNQRIMKISIRDTTQLVKSYLHNYLLSPMFLDELYATANGTRQANLSSRTILTLTITFPKDIGEQKSIVNRLTTIKNDSHSLQSNYIREIEAFDELKKSILHKAFNGEL